RSRIFQRVRTFHAGRDQKLTHLFHIASVSYTDRNPKAHPGIAVGPVSYRRVDKLRVGNNGGDVVVRDYDRAARADLLHLADDARDFHAVANRDRTLRQDDETADEIARNILQTKTDTHAHGPSENRQRSEMDARVLENNKNADDEDQIADDLRDRKLQRAVETTLN